MQGKTTKKLHTREGHQFLIGIITVIFVGKGHTVVVDVFDACIAEGHGRFHYQDETQFVRQARGSLSETLDHLICALDEEYITDKQYNGLRIQYEVCMKLMNGNIAYLQKKINE